MKGGFEKVSLRRRRTGVSADVGAVLGKEDRSTTCSTRPTEAGVLQSFGYLNDPPPQETGLYGAGKEVWLSEESWGRICWGGIVPSGLEACCLASCHSDHTPDEREIMGGMMKPQHSDTPRMKVSLSHIIITSWCNFGAWFYVMLLNKRHQIMNESSYGHLRCSKIEAESPVHERMECRRGNCQIVLSAISPSSNRRLSS